VQGRRMTLDRIAVAGFAVFVMIVILGNICGY